MCRLMTAGLWVLGLAVGGAGPALAQEGWGDYEWWEQVTLAVVQGRLDQGADPTARAGWGQTPLHYVARYSEDPTVTALLLDRGAAVNARTRDGQTPLHEAAGFNANPAVVALLLDRGADLTARQRFGGTPLRRAAQFNANPAVLALLLDRSTAVTAQDQVGLLCTAAGYNNPAVVTLLLDRGVAVDARDQDGQTPLHWAANSENPAVVALLLDRGAAVNARGWRGFTPLHKAAANSKNPAVVALLLDRGADPTLRDNENQRPIDLAEENEHLQGTDVYWRLNDAGYETRSERQPSPPARGQQREQREGGGGDLEAQLRQTEATCGRPYRGPTDRQEHSRFHCMYAYFLQCNNLVAQHRTVCAQYEAMRANGAPPCPHC